MTELTDPERGQLYQAFTDVADFFGEETIQRSDLWRRYNRRAEAVDGVEKVRSDDFGDLLVAACDEGLLESTVFGFEMPE